LKLKYDEVLSNFAFNFDLRRYILNPIVAVEIKVTLGGYTSLTFGDTEKSAFRQGLTLLNPKLQNLNPNS